MPSDLQYLTSDDIEELGMRTRHSEPFWWLTLAHLASGGAMTRVEKMRLQAALQTMRGEHQSGHSLRLRTECATARVPY